MTTTSVEPPRGRESVHLDDLDRRLLRCVQLAPRAPFRSYAHVLDVAEQTAARRYRRLREGGVVRVSAVVSAEASGETMWLVRVTCRPDGARSLGEAVARRDDVGWVFLAGAGHEVVFTVRSRTAAAREELLLRRIPASAPVIALSSVVVLHEFPSGASGSGHPLGVTLGAEREAWLTDQAQPEAVPDEHELDASDWALIRRLQADGRAAYADLATAAGLTHSTATRRVQSLLAQGVVTIGVDIATQALGRPTQAQVWMSVPPERLNACGTAIARLPEIVYAAAVSGTRNLMAMVVCAGYADLYRYLTTELAAVPGPDGVEVVPTVAMLKQASTLVEQEVLTS